MRKRPILIIDDNRDLCDLVTSVLGGAGFEVLSAPDGLSGLETARRSHPAAILLDMMMPGLDGLDTCRRLKKDRVLGVIPVIAITATGDLRYTERAFYAGAEFFLPKPFGAESLVHVVTLATGAARRDAPMRLRAHPRFPAEIPVRCRIGSHPDTARDLAGETDNVSLGGLLLFLPEPVDPRSVVRLGFDLVDEPISADGTVVWQHTQPMRNRRMPHGVRLLRFAEEKGLVQYRRYLGQLAAGETAQAG